MKGTLNHNITIDYCLAFGAFLELFCDIVCFGIALHKVDYYANSRTLH